MSPTFRHSIALLGALALASGCSSDPGTSTGSAPGAPSVSASATPPSPPPATFADKTLARAREWIAADMPYCGGPNGGSDVICGGTCERTGAAANPEWDAYRSDCSGFVSWSWGIAPPGRTTSTLAPDDTSESVVIDVTELAPGDALNGAGHVMLFGGWTNQAAGQATILEESACNTTAREKVDTFTTIDKTTLEISDGRKFQAIRYAGAK